MKIVVIGGTGKVGEELDNFYAPIGNDITFLTRRPLASDSKHIIIDPLDKKAVKDELYKIQPSVVINSIAYNNVDGAEENHREAMMLNAHLPEYLASICKVLDCHFITYSTDYIFDGESGPYAEDALPNPINYYGKTKLTGENMARIVWNKTSILRTNVVYGFSSYLHNDFSGWVRDNLEQETQIRVIEGQYSNPTYVGDIAFMTHKIAESGSYGIYNLGGSDYLNKYELALKVTEVHDLNKKLIKPIKPSELNQKAVRPERGGLDNFKVSNMFSFKFASFQDGLEAIRHKEKDLI
ncbi:MAG: NAD(P)-dependent oxidoreductase [Candidatus Kapaibacteriales bacterium]